MDKIKNHITYLNCLYKKIYILKKNNDIEYISDAHKCDMFLYKIYPQIKNMIKNISNDNKSDIEYIINIAKLYSYDKWKKSVKFNDSKNKIIVYDD